VNPAALRRRAAAWPRWRDTAAVGVALGALAVALALGGWALRLERLVYDTALALWRRPAPAELLIIAIDDASVQAIGRWPWKRAVHATLLERLAPARPRAVALDLLLSEPDADPEQDRLLAQALRRAAPVVAPVGWQGDGAGHIVALEPAPALRAALHLGAAEAGVESDGVLRDAFLSTRSALGAAGSGAGVVTGSATGIGTATGIASAGASASGTASASASAGGADARTGADPRGDPAAGAVSSAGAAAPADAGIAYPHLALALLQAGGEAVHPRTLAAVELAGAARPGALLREGRFAIRYLGPPGTVNRVSYAEVLAGAVAPERLAGRYLLVGMTAQGLGDTLATPVNSRHLAMPGVEVHANILHTLRSGDAIRTLAPAGVAALSLLLLLALLVAMQRLGTRTALPLALAAPLAAVAASALALQAGWWLSPVPFALAALLAYPLWSWRRLERAVRRLDGEIARLRATPALLGLAEPAGPAAAARARRSDSDQLEARLHTLRRAADGLREARHFLADALAALPTAVLVAEVDAAAAGSAADAAAKAAANAAAGTTVSSTAGAGDIATAGAILGATLDPAAGAAAIAAVGTTAGTNIGAPVKPSASPAASPAAEATASPIFDTSFHLGDAKPGSAIDQARVVLANPQAAALFDVDDADELLGLDLARLLGEFRTAEPLDWPATLARLRPGDAAVAVEARRDEPGGGAGRELLLHAAAVLAPGADAPAGTRRLIVTLADIAAVKQAERSREEALAFVSHDLRSPAQSIVLLADLNLQGALQTPREALLAEVRQLAARTLALSEGFVRAAQAQTQPLAREPVVLPALVDEVLAGLRPQALAAGLQLLAPPPAAGLPPLAADRMLLARALANLVGNAIRHAPAGTAVVVGLEADEQHLRLSVRDAGAGLSQAQWAQLERGVAGPAEGAAVGDARGVGLGLLFVQRVARRHGGALRARPPAPGGGGACLTIELPLPGSGNP
jgi:CHASE2 domain-containing sensor protein/signal transduction histidine kinase